MRRAPRWLPILACALLAVPGRARGNQDACFDALMALGTTIDDSRRDMIFELIGTGDGGILVSRQMIDSFPTGGAAEVDAIAALVGIQRGTSGVTSWGNLTAITSSDLGMKLLLNPTSRANLNAAQLDTIIRSDAALRARDVPLGKKVAREDGFYGSMMSKRALGTTTPDQNAVLDQMFPDMDATEARNFFWTSHQIPDALKQGLIRQGRPGYAVGGFQNPTRLADHFTDHGAEFGFANQAQYLAGAQGMANRTGPTVLEFEIVTDGVRQISKYDAATGELVIFAFNPARPPRPTPPATIQSYYKVDVRIHGCTPAPATGWGGLGGLVYFLRHCNYGGAGVGKAGACRPTPDTQRVSLYGC